jgi:hypothetical protein
MQNAELLIKPKSAQHKLLISFLIIITIQISAKNNNNTEEEEEENTV